MDHTPTQNAPSVSVVIPTLHRATALHQTLRDLQNQDVDNYEVIVIDQSDAFDEVANALLSTLPEGSSYIHTNLFRGLPQARNYGWQKCSAPIIVYIDDDVRVEADFLRRHIEAHERAGAEMVAGGITEARGDRDTRGAPGSFNPWTAEPTRNFHLSSARWCVHAPGGNFSIKRSAVLTAGGFDESLSVGAALYEETELGLHMKALGFSCWFEPSAHLTHLAVPAGGCRVQNDTARYVFGMAHNRSIVIFRHLRRLYQPTAILRIIAYGISYSRSDRSMRPFIAAIRGIMTGRRASRDRICRHGRTRDSTAPAASNP